MPKTKMDYKKAGLPHRTARTIARSWGAKVPPLPAEGDYCSIIGAPHGSTSCKVDQDAPATKISESGGNAKLPINIKPFTLGK